jgi:hypothetical protein
MTAHLLVLAALVTSPSVIRIFAYTPLGLNYYLDLEVVRHLSLKTQLSTVFPSVDHLEHSGKYANHTDNVCAL